MLRGKTHGNPTPAYFRLQSTIQKRIENGHWIPGERIPPERSLAEDHKISIGTVKKAIINLVNEGYLFRIQGKGTYVAGTTLRRESLRYYRLLKEFNGREAALKIKLLELRDIPGRMPHNRHLRLTPDQGLYEIKRMFLLKGQPIVYSFSYLSQKMFPGLHEQPVSFFEKITLYEALEKEFGVPTINNKELFSATQADRDLAGLLEIQEGTPLLAIDMLAYTYKKRPYEYRRSFCVSGERGVFREF